jgi:AcrR family transcriptional regulator
MACLLALEFENCAGNSQARTNICTIAHIVHIVVTVKTKVRQGGKRRKPTQRRAQQTVEAILGAVVRILKRESAQAVTTNHIAEVAGVSIGSVYQYFPDKRAIFRVLHQRHIEEIDRLIESTLVENAGSSLENLIRALIEAMVDAHSADPELYQALFSEVPHMADETKDFPVRLHGAFRLALASRVKELKPRDLDKAAFVVAHMIDSLSHGAMFRRPQSVSLAAAKEEAMHAVLAYLQS